MSSGKASLVHVAGYTLLVLLLVELALIGPGVEAWRRSRAKRVITLSKGKISPESVTTNGRGRLWASLYNPAGVGAGEIVTWTTDNLKAKTITLSGTTSVPSKGVAGIHYRKSVRDLLLVDNVQSTVYSVDPDTGVATVFTTIPLVKTSAGATFVNDLTEDSNGNVYITDSVQGLIFVVGPTGGSSSVWSSDAVLSAPGLGVNGLGFSRNYDILYVAVTAANAIYSIPILSGDVAGTPVKFANTWGPDGLRVDDDDGSVWVAANAGSEIDVFNSAGRAVDVKGDFEGVDDDDVPRSLMGPAGLVKADDKNYYIVNAAFPGLGLFDQYATKGISRYTICRVRGKISS